MGIYDLIAGPLGQYSPNSSQADLANALSQQNALQNYVSQQKLKAKFEEDMRHEAEVRAKNAELKKSQQILLLED